MGIDASYWPIKKESRRKENERFKKPQWKADLKKIAVRSLRRYSVSNAALFNIFHSLISNRYENNDALLLLHIFFSSAFSPCPRFLEPCKKIPFLYKFNFNISILAGEKEKEGRKISFFILFHSFFLPLNRRRKADRKKAREFYISKLNGINVTRGFVN